MAGVSIFLTNDLKSLMKNKNIVFLGDSNIRALYKDFLCLMNEPKMIPTNMLRTKVNKIFYYDISKVQSLVEEYAMGHFRKTWDFCMEDTVLGDQLIKHNEKSNARTYREERQIDCCNIKASFYFLTKVYDDYVKRVLKKITTGRKPDVLVINSFLWDITRWGSSGVEEYKKNLTLLMEHLQRLLPDCLVIWMTTPPISKEVRGGFLVEELKFLEHALRYHVLEGNCFARQVVVEHGFDVVDCHYHLKLQIHRRADDGIHWKPEAMRYILNLLLTHISLAWRVPLPRHGRSKESITEIEQLVDESLEELFPTEEAPETSKNIDRQAEQEPGPSNQGQAKSSKSKACVKPIQAKRFIKKIIYP